MSLTFETIGSECTFRLNSEAVRITDGNLELIIHSGADNAIITYYFEENVPDVADPDWDLMMGVTVKQHARVCEEVKDIFRAILHPGNYGIYKHKKHKGHILIMKWS